MAGVVVLLARTFARSFQLVQVVVPSPSLEGLWHTVLRELWLALMVTSFYV